MKLVFIFLVSIFSATQLAVAGPTASIVKPEVKNQLQQPVWYCYGQCGGYVYRPYYPPPIYVPPPPVYVPPPVYYYPPPPPPVYYQRICRDAYGQPYYCYRPMSFSVPEGESATPHTVSCGAGRKPLACPIGFKGYGFDEGTSKASLQCEGQLENATFYTRMTCALDI